MRLTDEQIGAELQALRELPSEQFASELDAWAAEGFPTVKQLQPARSGFWFLKQRPILTAAGSLAVVLVVAVSVAAYLHENGTSTDSGGDSGEALLSASPGSDSGKLRNESANLDSVEQSASGAASTVGPAPVASPTGQPRTQRAQVQELSASLDLSTDASKVQDAADGVVQVTNRYDGFVDSSDLHVGGKNSHASFTLRIPATHLRDALEDLSVLGRVTSRDEGSSNVTAAYVDAGKRYHQARTKVDSLLEDLSNASGPSEAAAIRQQLESARQELAAAQSALGGVKQRVTYAPVNVQIKAQGDGSWTIGDAADDAGNVLVAIGGALLIALAVLVPLAALIALGWFGAREFNRRRREAALDR
jgi:Domain of unknown function (DUF4349)